MAHYAEEEKMQTTEQQRLSMEYDRARTTGYGRFAANLLEATQSDPTRVLSGRIVDVYSTITATGFVIEQDGERYDVRVSKARY